MSKTSQPSIEQKHGAVISTVEAMSAEEHIIKNHVTKLFQGHARYSRANRMAETDAHIEEGGRRAVQWRESARPQLRASDDIGQGQTDKHLANHETGRGYRLINNGGQR